MSANVFVLGTTSLITDTSSEMVVSIVPLFLTTQLGFSATRFGLFEGTYQASTSLLRLWDGSYADRTTSGETMIDLSSLNDESPPPAYLTLSLSGYVTEGFETIVFATGNEPGVSQLPGILPVLID